MYDRVEKLRKSRGLPVSKVEKDVGFSNGSLKKISEKTECGRVYALSKYFNVSMEYLVSGVEPGVPSLSYEDQADDQLRFCILLGIRGLRRGEIAALKYEDLKNGVAHVHADMVKGPDKKWHYKEIPKTMDSDRFVRIPDPGDGEGFIVKWRPDTITKRFIELRDRCGFSFPFHQLRHYFASAGVVLGIPELYLADMGGWNRGGSSAMRAIYQNNIKSMSDFYADRMEEHLQKLEGSP